MARLQLTPRHEQNLQPTNTMSQHYSNPSRTLEPTALPDVEVFTMSLFSCYCENCDTSFESAKPDAPKGQPWAICPDCAHEVRAQDFLQPLGQRFYWHSCFPGCLPDSDPVGPFTTKDEALTNAQSNDNGSQATWDAYCEERRSNC